MKILLTALVKGDSEYDMFERMLTSFMPYMGGLAVAITGIGEKTNRIKALIKRYKGTYIVTTPETHPLIYLKDKDTYIFGSFAEARIALFNYCETLKEEYDWWSWADTDDIIINGKELEACAARAKEMKLDAVFFTYWYAVKVREDGTFSERDVQINHIRERLLRPGIWKWVSRLHEIALPKEDAYQPQISEYDFNPKEGRECVWVHLTDKDRVETAMKRNIKILEMQKREEEAKGQPDPRTTFYLAKTYYDMHTKEGYQLSDLLLDEYLEKSGWAEERSSAWEYKGNIKCMAGNHRGAIDCYHMAIKEFGNRHIPIMLLAKEYAEVGDMVQHDFWLDIVLKMEPPKARTTIGNPLEIKYMAASMKYNQAIRNNDIKDAIFWLKTRNDLVDEKDDGMIKTLEDVKLLNDAGTWVFNYAKWLKEKGYKNKIKHLLESLPLDLGREAFAHYIANEVNEPQTWDDKSIVYFASWNAEHFEKWSPLTVAKGQGGSETAVVELARRWAKKGYKVTVFGDPREDEGEYEGVMYKPWYTINWNDTFNILILWRSPHLLDKEVKAKKLFMDLHDIASQLDWTEERMKKIDKVFFKSQFQRAMLPKLPDEKAIIISNGI